jgi:hypothetical protein
LNAILDSVAVSDPERATVADARTTTGLSVEFKVPRVSLNFNYLCSARTKLEI